VSWHRTLSLTAAQSKLAGDNVGLVYAMLQKFTGRPATSETIDPDTLSHAEDALCRAARSFKPELGFKFSTYACKAILRTLYREHGKAKEKAARMPTAQLDEVRPPIDTRRPTGETGLEDLEQYAKCMAALNERERFVLTMRLGGARLVDVGRMLGVTKEWVRRIEKDAHNKARFAVDN
jgi:RNA polymerase primary sigma factor